MISKIFKNKRKAKIIIRLFELKTLSEIFLLLLKIQKRRIKRNKQLAKNQSNNK